MLKLLDFFFTAFHTVLIFFNLFGWIWKKTRFANLITLLLTGGSWFLLGIFYGLGYCPLTDWHFNILTRLGEVNLPDSYIEYLIERFFPIDLKSRTVDLFTMLAYLTALAVSISFNLTHFISVRRKRLKLR